MQGRVGGSEGARWRGPGSREAGLFGSVAFAGGGGFFSGGGAGGGGAGSGGFAAFFATLFGGGLVGFFTAAGAGFFSTAAHFVFGGPGPTFGFFLGDAAFFVAFFDVLGLAFLFARVTGLVAAWHSGSFRRKTRVYGCEQTPCRPDDSSSPGAGKGRVREGGEAGRRE